MFIKAVENNDIEKVKTILKLNFVKDNEGLILASKKGYTEIVKLILTHNIVFDLFASQALDLAAENGNTEIVQLLLEYPLINFVNGFNSNIKKASENGHIETVKLLLKDSRIDPSDWDNYPIRIACRNEHIEIVKLLLTDPRVDPSDVQNSAIKWSVIDNKVELLKLLLKDSRVDPSADDNFCIRYACKNGYTEIVKLLLTDSRINPSDRNNESILRTNSLEIVKLLLKDSRTSYDWKKLKLKDELIKEVRKDLEKEIIDTCISIEQCSPKIKIFEENIVKEITMIPKNIVTKIVYIKIFEEIWEKMDIHISSIKIISLAGILKIEYNLDIAELCEKIKSKIDFQNILI